MIRLVIRFTLKTERTRAKDLLPNINRTQAARITPVRDGMFPSLLRDVVCSERITMCHAAEWTIHSLPWGDGSAQYVFVPRDLGL